MDAIYVKTFHRKLGFIEWDNKKIPAKEIKLSYLSRNFKDLRGGICLHPYTYD